MTSSFSDFPQPFPEPVIEEYPRIVQVAVVLGCCGIAWALLGGFAYVAVKFATA